MRGQEQRKQPSPEPPLLLGGGGGNFGELPLFAIATIATVAPIPAATSNRVRPASALRSSTCRTSARATAPGTQRASSHRSSCRTDALFIPARLSPRMAGDRNSTRDPSERVMRIFPGGSVRVRSVSTPPRWRFQAEQPAMRVAGEAYDENPGHRAPHYLAGGSHGSPPIGLEAGSSFQHLRRKRRQAGERTRVYLALARRSRVRIRQTYSRYRLLFFESFPGFPGAAAGWTAPGIPGPSAIAMRTVPPSGASG